MGWVDLAIAGVLEVAFTTAIRYTDGFTKLMPTRLVLALAGASFFCVAKSTATIPLGTAIIGIAYFGEPANV